MFGPGLYAIINVEEPVTKERIRAWAARARAYAQGGAAAVQLRAKGLRKEDWWRLAEALRAAVAPPCAFIINDSLAVALAAKADGVHLGQTDVVPAAARELLGPRVLVGLSTHNLKQVRAARREPVDYLGFGPVYATASKADADPVVGLEGLAKAVRASAKPIVAIGGITTAERVEAVAATGVHGVVVLSALEAWGDPCAAVSELGPAVARGRAWGLPLGAL